jgi:hypothetical protein
MSKKSNGFSKLPHGFHKRLKELTGSRLKVWLVHRCMEGKGGTSYPSLKALAECTGLDDSTVKEARKWLREHGWLVSEGQSHTAKGKFSVPVEKTVIPVVGKADDGKGSHGLVGKADHGAVGNTVVGKADSEVDPSDDVEVDPIQVDPAKQGVTDLSDEQSENHLPTPTENLRSMKAEEAQMISDFISVTSEGEPADPLAVERFWKAQDFAWNYNSLAVLRKVLNRKDWKSSIQTQDDLAWRMESKGEHSLFAQFERGWAGYQRAHAAESDATTEDWMPGMGETESDYKVRTGRCFDCSDLLMDCKCHTPVEPGRKFQMEIEEI